MLWRIFLFFLLSDMAAGVGWAQSPQAQTQGLAHFIMGVSDDLNGRKDQAAEEYRKSIKYNGAQALPRLKLGLQYLALNQTSKATSQLKQAARLSPENIQVHYLLALIYSAEHKYGPATKEYEAMLKIASQEDPGDIDAYMYLGQLYYAQGKYAQAVEQFSKITHLQPSNASALFLLGSVYADNNNTSQAIPVFRQVLEMDPRNGEALNSLAYMYALDGTHLEEAVTMARKALEAEPQNGAYYDTLGWSLYKKGSYAESLEALQNAQKYIEDPVLYEHIADVYKALKDDVEACQYWHKSLRMDPNQAAVKQKIKGSEYCGKYAS